MYMAWPGETVAVGDRVAVETPNGNITTGTVVDRSLEDEDRRPVPYVNVEVQPGIRLVVRAADVAVA